jgi:hypothetical protein
MTIMKMREDRRDKRNIRKEKIKRKRADDGGEWPILMCLHISTEWTLPVPYPVQIRFWNRYK